MELTPISNHPEQQARRRRLLAEIQQGLPLVSRPYAEIGERVGMSERQVLETLTEMIEQGLIKRFGVVVRHRKLGYVANAMVVWNVPDTQVTELGQRFAASRLVSLCYQRPRRLPDWPYNLFTMIHGQDRDSVIGHARQLASEAGVAADDYRILFSRRCFKQCGARYFSSTQPAHASQRRVRG